VPATGKRRYVVKKETYNADRDETSRDDSHEKEREKLCAYIIYFDVHVSYVVMYA
jgi:hypothetical protein